MDARTLGCLMTNLIMQGFSVSFKMYDDSNKCFLEISKGGKVAGATIEAFIKENPADLTSLISTTIDTLLETVFNKPKNSPRLKTGELPIYRREDINSERLVFEMRDDLGKTATVRMAKKILKL